MSLDLASGFHVRSIVRTSRTVAAAALWGK
jgi:hypothetical protein